MMLSNDALASFCERWQIAELALFGSSLRDDFEQESDVDLLVTFHEGVQWGLLEHVQMENELEVLLQREVDLISRAALERSPNWLRRRSILNSAKTIYSDSVREHVRS